MDRVLRQGMECWVWLSIPPCLRSANTCSAAASHLPSLHVVPTPLLACQSPLPPQRDYLERDSTDPQLYNYLA